MRTIQAECDIIVRSKINGNMYQILEYIENHYNYTKPRQMFLGAIITADGKVSARPIELEPDNLEVISAAEFENCFPNFFN